MAPKQKTITDTPTTPMARKLHKKIQQWYTAEQTKEKLEECIQQKVAKDKKRLADIQKIIDKAKMAAEHEMTKLGTDILQAGSYRVEKKTRKMERINKRTCPHDIWRNYSTLYTYRHSGVHNAADSAHPSCIVIPALVKLGFDISVKKRIRFYGVDTWESRTRNKEEKKKV